MIEAKGRELIKFGKNIHFPSLKNEGTPSEAYIQLIREQERMDVVRTIDDVVGRKKPHQSALSRREWNSIRSGLIRPRKREEKNAFVCDYCGTGITQKEMDQWNDEACPRCFPGALTKKED